MRWVLVNGVLGIAAGASTNSLPDRRCADKVIKRRVALRSAETSRFDAANAAAQGECAELESQHFIQLSRSNGVPSCFDTLDRYPLSPCLPSIVARGIAWRRNRYDRRTKGEGA